MVLLGYSLKNALANPPYRILDKLKAASFVKPLNSFYQTNIPLINEVCESKTSMLISLRNGHYET